jgi:uncharacterized protein
MSEQFQSIGTQGDQADFVTLDQPIGKAGEQGEAWRAYCTNSPGLQYVVKICKTPSGTSGTSVANFKRECDVLAALDHPNIVRITDSGDVLKRGSDLLNYPFYTMEFLGKDVVTLKQALVGEKVKISDDRKLLLCLCTLRDAASALMHVHQREYCHGDIKESNILISGIETSSFKIKLIDFGFSHHLVPRQEVAKDETAGPEKHSSIRRRGDPISDENHDIFQLCYMVRRCIAGCFPKIGNPQPFGTPIYWPIDYAVFPKLMDLVNRWASEDSGSEPDSRSAKDFFDEFGRLTRDYDLGPEVRGAAKYLSIPEIATAAQLLKPFEALRLPPRQQVLYTEPIKKLITSSEFGALRYVRQLGFTHLVYPGAQGTRFEHSLGVFDLACHVVVRMSGRETFRSVCDDPRDIVKFIVAALLHDVGHFPFAHQLEEFGETDFDQQDLDRVRTLLGGHVNRGRQAIRGLEGLLHKLFNFTKEDVEDIVWLALGDEGKKPNEDASNKPRTKSLLFLRTLIDGPTDLDKMDYIERDAHHCGVPYGFFIDVARITETMRILDGKKNIGRSALGFDVRAVGSLEQFATARHQLYANVYWHRAVRSATVMFKHAFYLFQQLIGNREDLEDLFYKTASDDCLLYRMTQLTEKIKEKADQKPEDKKKACAVLALLGAISGNKKRVLYKSVLEIDRTSHVTDKPFGQQIYTSQRLKAKEIFDQLNSSGFFAEEASIIGQHNVLIDCHTDTFPVFGKIQIIRGDADDPKDLREFAPTVEHLEKSFTQQACKIRVFVNPDALKPGYRSKAGRADVRKFIEAKIL